MNDVVSLEYRAKHNSSLRNEGYFSEVKQII